jgi:hypothetical protein
MQPAQEELPPVFVLGEFDKQYEAIMSDYASLLTACDEDMKIAFDKLVSMMKEMEAYAKLTGYNLDGIKLWVHIFWRKDGSIEHLGFHLKPNSRNVEPVELKNFLVGFMTQYKFPLTAPKKFSHYTTFSFPVITSTPTNSGNNTAQKKQNGNY